MSKLSSLILAAGKGVRMKSSLPKVLHPLGGRSLIQHVCRTHSALALDHMIVVVGHKGEQVKKHLAPEFKKIRFYKQPVLNGSGGAVRVLSSWLRTYKGDLLVVCGDAPLLTEKTLKELLATHRTHQNSATVLSVKLENPTGYGRILRSPGGFVSGIVEEIDASPAQRKISEVNSGAYCFNSKKLACVLPLLRNRNAKKEYYLTDALEHLRREGGQIGAYICPDSTEALGINSRFDLALAQKVLFHRKSKKLMQEGVTIVDPGSTFIHDEVKVGVNTVIWPQTILVGRTQVGANCEIGPWAHIVDSKIENDAKIKASFIESSLIRKKAKIGPFSRVRPHSVIGPGAALGNFSEIKNTTLGEGSKANHLSYLGDSTIGKNVNIGAGTITCNYDGFQKHPTVIQDQAFIGSNVNLVAPIKVGAHSVVGAGSSLSENVPPWSLALERATVKVKKGWARQKRKKKKK